MIVEELVPYLANKNATNNLIEEVKEKLSQARWDRIRQAREKKSCTAWDNMTVLQLYERHFTTPQNHTLEFPRCISQTEL